MTDTTNIESLYRQHGAALVLFAVAMTGDRGRAQDAVHQVFLKFFQFIVKAGPSGIHQLSTFRRAKPGKNSSA